MEEAEPRAGRQLWEPAVPGTLPPRRLPAPLPAVHRRPPRPLLPPPLPLPGRGGGPPAPSLLPGVPTLPPGRGTLQPPLLTPG